MKIIHVEDFFHPDAGYQINILPKYQCKQGHSVAIVTSEIERVPVGLTAFFGKDNIEERDREYTKKTGVEIYRVPIYKFLSGRAIYKPGLKKFIDSLSPDLLYVHGNDTAIGILYALRARKLAYRIVFDSHMLEMASQNVFKNLFRMFYKSFITPIIKKEKLIIIRTQNDDYVSRFLGVPLVQSPWISVGADTLLFSSDRIQKNEFRNKYNISENDFVVLYTGKLDESKGGKFLAEAFKQKFNNNLNVVLVVVGNTSGEYGKEVEMIFKQSENRVLRFPTQRYVDLPQFYQGADLSVFPKQCSLSFYDAQACGLPVVSEDNNINIDRLQNNNGFCFKSGDIVDFRDKIGKCVNMKKEEYKKMGENASDFITANYNYKNIAEQYTKILKEEYIRNKKMVIVND
ncbi:glycosyltransferase [Peribacillus frigoritolerans]|uniref:glycosyltransferase n=1 Tax=Peribacillus frigoritolerans TaxID=450367 RepID=UPI001F4F231D|nr:glycosyltransferase [Peribacillus frigoritolerans]MCK2016880.1 glycosyltransferase [Peribacillus frigoritolerans]